ncbi:MAG: PEP-utilizing enzyme [Acidimicrobiia bacterium]
MARWHTEWRGQLAVEIESWRQQELQPAAFLELVGMGHELLDLMDRAAMIHFELFVPYLLGVHRWVEDAKKLLGWDDARSIAALAGHSPASSEPTRLMTEVVRAIRETGGVESVRASANPLAAAAELGGEVAQALERWEAVVGFRLSDYDIAAPLVSEIPGLMSSLLRAALDASDVDATVGIDLDAAHLAPEDRSRLVRSFAAATAVFPLREENVHLTSSMPGAALRRVIAEIGSRLAADGLIDRVDDVFYLTWDEIQRPPVDAANLVRRRLAEEAWTAAHPGPPFHGPPPGAPPDVRGLPGPARRINGALLWAMQHELAARPEVTGEAVRGTGCSAGVHVGRVRLVRTEADLSRLEPGDVMVCPIATTAWSVVFGMIGAIVCDGGGVLSHTAIVAREHGIPAVMGVGNGTTKLVDGEIVRVDGTRGTVEKV